MLLKNLNYQLLISHISAVHFPHPALHLMVINKSNSCFLVFSSADHKRNFTTTLVREQLTNHYRTQINVTFHLPFSTPLRWHCSCIQQPGLHSCRCSRQLEVSELSDIDVARFPDDYAACDESPNV